MSRDLEDSSTGYFQEVLSDTGDSEGQKETNDTTFE